MEQRYGYLRTNTWTGLGSGEWSTVSTKNWTTAGRLPTSDGNVVLFDDTATGTTSISISAANVSPRYGGVQQRCEQLHAERHGWDYRLDNSRKVIQWSVNTNSNGYSGGTTLNGGMLDV